MLRIAARDKMRTESGDETLRDHDAPGLDHPAASNDREDQSQQIAELMVAVAARIVDLVPPHGIQWRYFNQAGLKTSALIYHSRGFAATGSLD